MVNRERRIFQVKSKTFVNAERWEKVGLAEGAPRAQQGCAVRREWETRTEQIYRSLNARLRVLGSI